MSELNHFDAAGQAHMVPVGQKPETHRQATATGSVRMRPETLTRIRAGTAQKGDVLGVARLAGILGAKQTASLIPLCHPLALTSVTLDFAEQPPDRLLIQATATVFGRTGVEMEALVAVSVAALTVVDMVKAIDRDLVIEQVQLIAKSGGQHGDYRRQS